MLLQSKKFLVVLNKSLIKWNGSIHIALKLGSKSGLPIPEFSGFHEIRKLTLIDIILPNLGCSRM